MSPDGVLTGSGFGATAIGLAAIIAGDIGGIPFEMDGGATTFAILGLVGAFCGLALAAVRISKDGLRVRVTHTVDPTTRKLIDTATTRLERNDSDAG